MTSHSGRTFLHIAAETWQPWTKVEEQPGGGITVKGPMAELLTIVARQLDFDYELKQPHDHVWGTLLPNGSWSGMLGMLQREEVEFALGPFGVTQVRETVCDFSLPVYSENNAILMVRPGIGSDITGFVKPFTFQVWVLVLVAMVATWLTFTLSLNVENLVVEIEERVKSASTLALWVFKTLTQEASTWLPSTNASRLVVVTWLLSSMVFMSVYSGILTAMLTVPRVTIPIDSQEDLVAQSQLPWRLETGSMMFQYYQEAKDGIRRRVFEGHSGTFPDCYASRKEIANGEFAGICDKTTMKKAMSWDFSTSGKCHLYMSREVVYSNAILAMAFRTNSSFLRPVNRILRRLKEAGFIDKWLGAELTNTTQCLRPPSADGTSEGIRPLDLASFLGVLLVFGAGHLLAFVVFLVEVLLSMLTNSSP
ncbi:putative glutamate receptor isoform X1 [Oratosquilla oratoria]|uniref:putative glutamate receptor isoform X1 n=1 Tax=Oratosquilla oratoria TaxID=337810 RepID=UPI003F767AE7